MKYKYEIIYPKIEVTKETPIVMTLHGMNSSYFDLRPLVPVFGKDVIELHIQGDLNYGSGYAYFIPKFIDKTETEVIGDVIAGIHDQVEKILGQKNLQGNPLFCLGFSQGAIISAGLSIFYPNWLDVVAILSARLPQFYIEEARKSLTEKKLDTGVFISQGQKDPVFPLETGRKLASFFRKYTDNVEYHEYPGGHIVDYSEPKDIYDWFNEFYITNN
ncbi:alpha/beta hydrolase [Liquorilactobacillus mali]|uniref:Phospholipase carboxylesterase n=1 Tax=Liquorilactobacillus mali KCTC 3596 = DSM 20444 TaxID=1046596 RepID=J0L051_9LACO|nr:phospholipase [Liquorilactobacillus mali]EJF00569.1 phospholipase/carboxylesterase [Liquorilactobacillus mali KCTC 3596 = DSM 20444]KRN10182.1 phospholipase carboxylesterase [Liquorilactobacillus mali KCTC 3596 = DSM 20444]MDC7953054.1 phospholipase [Liquorilactobacillus mali]QFQ74054.1 phospholipase [Liquorilactobacillus mali]